jgi:ATP-dependent phosphoenolpyruvate carboxykinase
MADTKISTVLACRVSHEVANAAYDQARITHTTVNDMLKEGLALVMLSRDAKGVLTPVARRTNPDIIVGNEQD